MLRSLCALTLACSLVLALPASAGEPPVAPPPAQPTDPQVQPPSDEPPIKGVSPPFSPAAGEVGSQCAWPGDCHSHVCENQRCAAANCHDGIKNQDEASVDCGGSACAACPDYEPCTTDTDCHSGVCVALVTKGPREKSEPFLRGTYCVPNGTCHDSVLNGRETGIDCGGPQCHKCEDNQGCSSGIDCRSGLCINNVCKAGGSCHDFQLDGQETDVDCGGKVCGRCVVGKVCRQHDDCESSNCVEGICKQAPPHTSDFVDTRINFTLTDENMLVKPGETNPNVPGLRIDRPNQFGILFFDNYDTRYTGYENLTHIVLYKKYEYDKLRPGRFTAEGALALRFLQFSDVNMSTLDDSSYIRVALNFDAQRTLSNLSLTVFPLSADRMRLGYSYRLSWGGSPIFFKFNPDLPQSATPPVNSAPAPGARLQYASEHFTIWAGFKTSTLINKNPTVSDLQAIYGFLAGLAAEGAIALKETQAPLFLRFDLNGGYFDRGNNPNFYPTQTVGPSDCILTASCKYPDFPVWTAGASAQLSLWRGLPPSLSDDYSLFRNDPTSAARYFAKPHYRPGVNWLFQTEFTYLASSVQDFDQPNSTTRQFGYAGDINFRLQSGRSRFKVDASMRSLEFMLVNQPSLVPYTSFPKGSDVQADRFVSIGYDYNVRKIGLTFGPTLGVDLPASIRPPASLPQLCGNTGGSLCTPSTIVVRGEGDYSILPQFQRDSAGNVVKDSSGNPVPVSALPVVAAKLVLREDFLDYFAAILDLYYSHDPNQTHLTKAPDGTELRDFNHPDVLGFNLTLQARF
jgi:hypothetical protein